ncbi:hypothetical protein [Ktedonobacter racemifer]|uniref:Uncharacterized protein n=1 Tax=Ktedonobacter racemifer DSM 44963 TaxID=485913 RepID=D6TMP1_KTERA|nr:hypothetical protein [Ktedonobacter racemifer]EFH87041.1 hypothetical protein Krac_8362 [Ktedonobacter racemifer DSM 44963]
MQNRETTFIPELLDEQIECPANWLTLDDQQLVQDLRLTCETYWNKYAHSLQSAWDRIEQARLRLSSEN